MNKLTEDEVKKMQEIGYDLISEGGSYTRDNVTIYVFSKKKREFYHQNQTVHVCQ